MKKFESNSYFERFRNISLFDRLPDEMFLELFNLFSPKRILKNQILYLEEEYNSRIYLVIRGRIISTKANLRGSGEKVLNIALPGNFVDETTVFREKTMPCTAAALDDSLVAIANREDFLKIVSKDMDFCFKVFARVQRRLDYMLKQIDIKGQYSNAEEYVRDQLWSVAGHYGYSEDDGSRVVIQLKRDYLATIFGMTRETFSRAVNKMAKENLIAILKRPSRILVYKTTERSLLKAS